MAQARGNLPPVVDGAGRKGSVEHRLRAGVALSDAPVVLGTVEVADAEAPGGGGPAPEAVVSSGGLAVWLDVHAESSWVFTTGSASRSRWLAARAARPWCWRKRRSKKGTTHRGGRRSAAARLAVGELSPGRYVAGVRVVRRGDEVTRIDRPSRIADRRGGGCGNLALGGSRWAESVRQDDTVALDVSRRRLRRRAGARPGGCHRACDR